MPRFQLHIVKAKNGENVRQPIVEAEDALSAVFKLKKGSEGKLKRDEAIVAVTEVSDAHSD